MQAVLAQGAAEALDHRLVDLLRCDALGRAPAHQPRQDRPREAVGQPPSSAAQAGASGCRRRPGMIRQPVRRHARASTRLRTLAQRAGVTPSRRRQGAAHQPVEQGGVGRQLVRQPAEHAAQGAHRGSHLAAPARVGLRRREPVDHPWPGSGPRDRGRRSGRAFVRGMRGLQVTRCDRRYR